MTAIQGYVKPSRRPGELGVHSLDHFHFSVPDLSVAQNFYGEFGLDLEAGANRIAMRTFGGRAGLGHDRRRTSEEARLRQLRGLRGRSSTGSPSACKRWASPVSTPRRA